MTTADKTQLEVIEFLKKNKSVIVAAILSFPIVFLFLMAVGASVNKAQVLVETSFVIMVFFVAAISLDLEVGSIGLPNFGKVAFIALGAYISTILFEVYFIPLPVAFIIAILVSGAFGLILALPTVKLRADYFAIMTIAGGEVFRLSLAAEKRYFWVETVGGVRTQVIRNSFKSDLSTTVFFGIDFSTIISLGPLGELFIWQIILFFILIISVVGVYTFIELIRKSPYGRALRAIREDDITVTSVGKDVMRFRWQVTTIAAMICGFSGCLYALFFSSFEAEGWKPFLTFDLFVFIIIGGLANSLGVLAGTALIQLFIRASQASVVQQLIVVNLDKNTPIIGGIMEILQVNLFINANNSRLVIVGIILILFLLYMPEGLIPEKKSNNNHYLSLLTADQRKRSDQAVAERQSLEEQERVKSKTETEPQ